MNSADIFGKSMHFPPVVGSDGRVQWSQGPDNVRESIEIILLTDKKERIAAPNFGAGLEQFLFEPNTVSTRHSIKDRIEKTLKEWEPRIQLDSVVVEQDPHDAQAAIATISYLLVATRERKSLNVTVQTIG